VTGEFGSRGIVQRAEQIAKNLEGIAAERRLFAALRRLGMQPIYFSSVK
jgi:hypothetical protein